MDFMILKLDKNLFNIKPIKGLNYKEVTANSWTELLIYRITLLFNNSIKSFRVLSVDTNNKLVINGCVYIFIEL